jgi:hypothetical protein
MHSRCMRRRPNQLSPANWTPPNAGFPVRLELTSAHDPQSRHGADLTHCAGDNGAQAERCLARSERDGRLVPLRATQGASLRCASRRTLWLHCPPARGGPKSSSGTVAKSVGPTAARGREHLRRDLALDLLRAPFAPRVVSSRTPCTYHSALQDLIDDQPLSWEATGQPHARFGHFGYPTDLRRV